MQGLAFSEISSGSPVCFVCRARTRRHPEDRPRRTEITSPLNHTPTHDRLLLYKTIKLDSCYVNIPTHLSLLNQPINRSINQSINRSINQSIIKIRGSCVRQRKVRKRDEKSEQRRQRTNELEKENELHIA